MKKFFPNQWFGLRVGVAAGLPNLSRIPPRDFRLGDVLVALSEGDIAGLVGYDLCKETEKKMASSSCTSVMSWLPPRSLSSRRLCDTTAVVWWQQMECISLRNGSKSKSVVRYIDTNEATILHVSTETRLPSSLSMLRLLELVTNQQHQVNVPNDTERFLP